MTHGLNAPSSSPKVSIPSLAVRASLATCLIVFGLAPRLALAAQAPLPAPSTAEVRSAAGPRASSSVHLTTQLLWEHKRAERASGGDAAGTNRLVFRRLRPVLRGHLPGKDMKYLLHVNVVPGALELMDMWVDCRLRPDLRLRVGQAKVPFTRYRLNSFKDRPVVDWSYPTRYFGAERQVGAMIHNDVGRPPPLEYQLGVYTGVNARVANGVGMSKIFGERRPSPSGLVGPSKMAPLHAEVVAHVARSAGGIDVRKPRDVAGGGLRYSVGVSAAWDLDPTPRRDMRLRLAPEAALKAHGLALSGVFYLGFWDEVMAGGRYRLGLTGGVVQASYNLSARYELAVRYATVRILGDLRADARAWSDDQIASAEGAGDKDALTEKYAAAGQLRAEHEVDLGVNVYLFGKVFKWQTDVALLVHDRPGGSLHDQQLRTQLQLAF